MLARALVRGAGDSQARASGSPHEQHVQRYFGRARDAARNEGLVGRGKGSLPRVGRGAVDEIHAGAWGFPGNRRDSPPTPRIYGLGFAGRSLW